MGGYRELMRCRLLEEMYDRLSDEDKRLFVRLTMQDRDHKEIMQALGELKQKADDNHHPFVLDFAANIAGNGAWSILEWIGSRLIRRL